MKKKIKKGKEEDRVLYDSLLTVTQRVKSPLHLVSTDFGLRVYARGSNKEFGFVIKELSPYRGEAGSSTRFKVLWKDGTTTICCVKGMESYLGRHFRIL